MVIMVTSSSDFRGLLDSFTSAYVDYATELIASCDTYFIPSWKTQDNWRELRDLYVGFRGHGRGVKAWLTRRGNSFADRRVNKWKSFNARLKRKYGAG